MTSIIQKINALQQKLLSLPTISDDNKRKLDKKFRLEFNYNSNHLEGNTLTYGETELLIYFDKTDGGHEMRELEEMKAHDVAYHLIQDWALDKEHPLNEQSIKELNKIILVKPFYKDAITPDGQATRRLIKIGDYKEYPNSVRLQNGEIFNYATPAETPIKMGELIAWYNTNIASKELHPIEIAALIHYKFVCIHPFDDGNGRISRLLMNYVLLANNLSPVIIKSEDKKNYLLALNQADTGNIEAFTNYIANQLIWSLELSIKATEGKSVDEVGDLDKRLQKINTPYHQSFESAAIRNGKLIKEIIDSRIKPLVDNIELQLKRFDKYFNERICFVKFDEKSNEGYELSDIFESVYYSHYDAFADYFNRVPEAISTIVILFKFKGFRTNNYSDQASYNGGNISITFYNHTYQISDTNGEVYYNKLYDEKFTNIEMQTITEKACMQLLEQIEMLVEKYKDA